MMTLLAVIVALGLIGACAYFNAPAVAWLSITTVTFLYLTFFTHVSFWLMLPAWLVFIATASILNHAPWRKSYLSKPLYAYLKRALPPISKTERIALDAGDVCVDGDIFRGSPDWSAQLNEAQTKLTEEEQAFIDNEVNQLCEILNDWEIFHDYDDLPEKAWQFIKDKGFWGLVIPKEYGGKGFSATAHSEIVCKIGSRSAVAGVTVMVPNSLGPAELLLQYGTEQQKDHYLPRLAKGQEIPCFALTSPEAGSDAGAIPDRGVICKQNYQGKETLGIKLNFEKHYITLAPVASLVGLAFKLYDPDKLYGDTHDLGITLAIIPADHPGMDVGQRHKPMALPFMNGPVKGQDVFIPLDMIIGGEAYIGQGWRMLMECLSIGRSISLPSMATTMTISAYRTVGAYARVRQQFNTPIGYFEGVEAALAELAGFAYINQSSRLMAADLVSKGMKPAVVSAIAKYHMTELARKAINHAMDVQGGRAIQMGPKNVLAMFYLALPVLITVEGANILTRNLMIFGQGAIRCHPYLRQEMETALMDDPKEALNTFDGLFQQHMAYGAQNAARTLFHGLTLAKFAKSPKQDFTAYYYHQLSRMSHALAFISDIAMLTLGGSLKRKERLSARLGDVMSHIYLAGSVLKHFDDNGRQEDEKALVEWALQYNLSQIQIAFDAFFRNFKLPVVKQILRWVVFPWGRSFKAPDDALGHKVAQQMLSPSALRDRLTQSAYFSENTEEATGLLDAALAKLIIVEPALKKCQVAVRAGDLSLEEGFDAMLKAAVAKKFVSEAEASDLRAYEKLRKDVVRVDAFAHEILKKKQVSVAKKSA